MKIGFTGTRLAKYSPSEVHHGGCVGADETFHNMVAETNMLVKVHPAAVTRNKQMTGIEAFTELPAKPPLDRNRDIVDAVDVMIATPGTEQEELRSGTWATIRYARSKNKPVYIVWPDGLILHEGD